MTIASAADQDPSLFRRTLELLPAGAYICDADGLITWFNRHAATLWGRTPSLNDAADRFCGSFRLFSSHDIPIAHDACWMALAIRDRREYMGHEIVIERPDRSRVTVLAYATPLLDAQGDVVGAVNILVNISERKRVEQLLTEANRTNDFYRAILADAMRNELMPMQAALEALEADETPPDERIAHIALLKQQLMQISALVDHLVDRKERVDEADSPSPI